MASFKGIEAGDGQTQRTGKRTTVADVQRMVGEVEVRLDGLRRRQEELASETRDRLARAERESQGHGAGVERLLAFVAIALAGLALAIALANSGRASQSSVDSVSRQVATLDDRVSSTGSQVDEQVQTALDRYLKTRK